MQTILGWAFVPGHLCKNHRCSISPPPVGPMGLGTSVVDLSMALALCLLRDTPFPLPRPRTHCSFSAMRCSQDSL